jgi:hypothetical protein
MLKQILKVQEQVKILLQTYPKLRDNDVRLVASYYYNNISNINQMSAIDFLQIMVNGNLPSPDTITRARRKIQEKHPELRGVNYVERQKLEKQVRQEINKL